MDWREIRPTRFQTQSSRNERLQKQKEIESEIESQMSELKFAIESAQEELTDYHCNEERVH